MQLTLKHAVIEAIKSLRGFVKSFSRHNVTSFIREKVNSGEWTLPGYENPDVNSPILYLIEHEDIRTVFSRIELDGTLSNMGINVNYGNPYVVYTFIPKSAQTTLTVNVNPTVNTAFNPPVAQHPRPINYQNKIEAKAMNYLDKCGLTGYNPTLKEVQSAVKVKGVTCEQLYNLIMGAGYRLADNNNTGGCYSTYKVTTT